jgi:ADP-heptose:LPS heptosyltransferase
MELPCSAPPLLIYRLGSLGDTVVALPCFHLIRRVYPDRRIVLLTNQPVSEKAAPAMEVLAGSGLCDEAIHYPIGLRGPHALAALRRRILSFKFDTAFHLNSTRSLLQSCRDHLFLRACGVKRIIGTPVSRRDLRIRRRMQPLAEQECVGLARRIRRIGQVDPSDRAVWDLHFRAEEREGAWSLLRDGEISKPFIAASMGTKHLANDWGDENWMRLLQIIGAARPELGLVLVGSPGEFERSERLRRCWRGSFTNACGRCNTRVSAAVLERAALFVGHDSGPMHLAAAVGAPVVAVFSWRNPPGQWFPGWIGWDHVRVFYPPLPGGVWTERLRTRRSPSEGILLIRPEPVADACSAFLGLAAKGDSAVNPGSPEAGAPLPPGRRP